MRNLLLCAFFALCIYPNDSLFAQRPEHFPDTLNSSRLKTLSISSGVGYGVGLTGLSVLWYAQQERQSFHFFNDNDQWKQMDKLGHAYTAFQLSRLGYRSLQWAGMDDQKALIWASVLGPALLMPIEVLDGFSATYGASWGDAVANLAGGLLFGGQYLLWDEIRIHPRFSFSRSPYAAMRPEVLGNGLHEEWLKDYNGQTYWFSIAVDRFLGEDSFWPGWLHLSLGYSADEMLFGRDFQNEAIGMQPARQFLLGLELNLSHWKGNNKWLNSLLFLAESIRLPGPALLYHQRQGMQWYWFYF